jgi:hypothetical protein
MKMKYPPALLKKHARALAGLKGQKAKEAAQLELMKHEVSEIEKSIAYMEEMEATYSNVTAFPV